MNSGATQIQRSEKPLYVAVPGVWNANSQTLHNILVVRKKSAGLNVAGRELNYKKSEVEDIGLLERLGFRRVVLRTGTRWPPFTSCHLQFHNFVFCPTHRQHVGVHVHWTDVSQEILNLIWRREAVSWVTPTTVCAISQTLSVTKPWVWKFLVNCVQTCEHFPPAEVLPVLSTEHRYVTADYAPIYTDQYNPTVFACPSLLLTTYCPAHSASRAAVLYVLLSTSTQRLFRTLGRWPSSTRQRKFQQFTWVLKNGTTFLELRIISVLYAQGFVTGWSVALIQLQFSFLREKYLKDWIVMLNEGVWF